MDAAIAPLVSQWGLSGTLMVVRSGTTVVSRSYGWADFAQRIPNRLDTRFRIGSITKQFTAMAVLLLQDRGKLRISDPICEYLTTCPRQWRPVTLHHLLTHTSGIATTGPVDVLPGHRPVTPQNLVSMFAGWPVDFPAGSRYRYGNLGSDGGPDRFGGVRQYHAQSPDLLVRQERHALPTGSVHESTLVL